MFWNQHILYTIKRIWNNEWISCWSISFTSQFTLCTWQWEVVDFHAWYIKFWEKNIKDGRKYTHYIIVLAQFEIYECSRVSIGNRYIPHYMFKYSICVDFRIRECNTCFCFVFFSLWFLVFSYVLIVGKIAGIPCHAILMCWQEMVVAKLVWSRQKAWLPLDPRTNSIFT